MVKSLSVSPIGSSPLQRGIQLSNILVRSRLSVSPIGSSPLQPVEPTSQGPYIEPFQYPQSDRALCNLIVTVGGGVGVGAFSIPNRIEPSATNFGRLRRRYANSFQYPQSDRALCNGGRLGSSPALRRLSVSPIGSSPLQLVEMVPESTSEYVSFSIPNRIEPSATLSQPQDGAGRTIFQYPQSDRALCNLAQPRLICRPVPLSVSPIGSSPLQPTTCESKPTKAKSFQYPQSDRALCNILRRQSVARWIFASFSIPNRIEPSAT